jgi:hypothetical protein
MGSDSLVTAERKYNHPRMAKITTTGPYLIGGSGEVAACDIVQHIWEPPIPTVADKKDLYHFMIAVIIPSLKKCFKENEYKWDAEDDETKFAFLIVGTIRSIRNYLFSDENHLFNLIYNFYISDRFAYKNI